MKLKRADCCGARQWSLGERGERAHHDGDARDAVLFRPERKSSDGRASTPGPIRVSLGMWLAGTNVKPAGFASSRNQLHLETRSPQNHDSIQTFVYSQYCQSCTETPIITHSCLAAGGAVRANMDSRPNSLESDGEAVPMAEPPMQRKITSRNDKAKMVYIHPELDVERTIAATPNFKAIPRFDATQLEGDEALEQLQEFIEKHVVVGGEPLVIENWHKRADWPFYIFKPRWLEENHGADRAFPLCFEKSVLTRLIF